MVVDAPVDGQQGYIAYFTNTAQVVGGLHLTPVVQTATIFVNIPAPATLPTLGLIGLAAARRRRAAPVNT